METWLELFIAALAIGVPIAMAAAAAIKEAELSSDF